MKPCHFAFRAAIGKLTPPPLCCRLVSLDHAPAQSYESLGDLMRAEYPQLNTEEDWPSVSRNCQDDNNDM
jgi:hypothetical protein